LKGALEAPAKVSIVGFNRTLEELKGALEAPAKVSIVGFNRTLEELKACPV